MERIFAGDRCVGPEAAVDALSVGLSEAGVIDWEIESGPEDQPDGCVVPGFDTVERRIVLSPALTPSLRDALQGVVDESLGACFTLEQAQQKIEDVLASDASAPSRWSVRTDGPLAVPADRIDEAIDHLRSGCYLYTGTGWTADGERLFFVSGPEALEGT